MAISIRVETYRETTYSQLYFHKWEFSHRIHKNFSAMRNYGNYILCMYIATMTAVLLYRNFA